MCAHEEVEITEIWSGHSITHYREKTGRWSHNQEPGNPTGKLIVECQECGFNKIYTPSNTPQWVKDLLDEALYRSSVDLKIEPRLPN